MIKILVSTIFVLMAFVASFGICTTQADQPDISYMSQSQVQSANRIYGMVEHVSDGDTIIVMTKYGERIKVRLYAIDAPEKAQPYGPQSTGILKNIVLNHHVALNVINTDRYGRKVAIVYVDGEDVNAMMIKLGAAWHYRYYDRSSNYNYYEKLESDARNGRKGLWNRDNPTPPWQYRKLMRELGRK